MAPKVEDASEAQNAINTRFVSIQNAGASKIQGDADAAVIKKKGFAEAAVIQKQGKATAAAAKDLQGSLEGADPAAIAALLLLKDKDVKIVPIGGSLPDILKNTLGGANK